MCPPPVARVLLFPLVIALAGCGYVHVGRLPAPVTTVIGDQELVKENAELRAEKKLLQQELALTRAQGDALRMAIENRAAEGDTSRRLVDRLNETSRELAALRSSYAELRNERDRAVATAADAAGMKARLAETEEKLAASLRTYTELQNEVATLRVEVTRTQDENLALSQQVKTLTARDEQAQAALAQLNTELLAQKNARYLAEKDLEAVRVELRAVLPNASALAQQRSGVAPEAPSLVSEHAAEVTALRGQLATLRGQVQGLEDEQARLKQQLAAAEKTPAALVAAEARLNAASSENEQLRVASARLAAEKAQLEQQLVSLQANSANPQPLQEQLRQVQARAVSLASENARLRSQLEGQAGGTPVVVAPTRIDLGSDAAPPVEAPAANPGSAGVNATLVTTVAAVPKVRPNPRMEVGGVRIHVVATGDTLARISTQYYGTPARWAEILAANRDVLGESNTLVVGRQLRIP